jgi:hypothetical protein
MKLERLASIGALCLLLLILNHVGAIKAASPEVTPPHPSPTPDPLATPIMPENPTQLDIGRNAYYYHCMACHGDRGQGLTEEWRKAWVHDHQNCWYRGCHSGRSQEEGFYIPREVPAVLETEHNLSQFRTAHGLYTYLKENHPPQRPDSLTESENWALTAFLLDGNDRTPSGDLPTSGGEKPSAGVIGAVVGGVLVAVLLILGVAKLIES